MQVIETFLSKMLPSFGKDRIIEDIRVTKGQLEELDDVYKTAADMLQRTKFSQPTVVAMFDQFKRVVGTGGDNMVVHISKNIKLVLANLTMVEGLVQNSLNNTIAAQGLTFKQATIIQYVNLIHFLDRYARKMLHYIYVLESTQYQTDPQSALEALSKPDLQWLQDNFLQFCNAFKSATFKTDDVLRKIEDVPEATVNEQTVRTLNSTLGAAKTDPLKLNFAGTWLNPIYAVRMMVAEWQVKRYKVAKDELAVLRLRHQQLISQRDGKENAKLEKEIAYYEGTIQRMSYELDKVEKANV